MMETHPEQALLVALSELAARVQHARTVDAVLATAGNGLLSIGLRLVACKVSGDRVTLMHVASRRSEERRVGKECRL